MSTRGIESLPNAESMVDGFVARLGVNAQGPYPNPQISAKNRQYAELLIPAFADGASAELTGIAQYFQHSLTIQDEVIANAELSISMSEMKHLELLGDMIKSLGATPRYGPGGDWSAKNVTYGETAPAKLQADIDSEVATIAAYQRILQQIPDQQVQAVIQRIIADEQEHLRIFREAHNRAAMIEQGAITAQTAAAGQQAGMQSRAQQPQQ